MAKKEYSESDYNSDISLINRLHVVRHSDVLGKLEVLMDVLDDKAKKLFIGHSQTGLQLISLDSAYNALENPAYLMSIILRRTEHLSGEGLKIFSDEIVSTIHKRVEEVFGQRYRGALERVRKYDHELAAPFLKELTSAIRSKKPDRVYRAAERFCIQTEDYPDNHPFFRAYADLKPKIEEILK